MHRIDKTFYLKNHTALPRLLINSISSGVKLAIEIDLTRCGGLRPRLQSQTNIVYSKHFEFTSNQPENYHVQTTGTELLVILRQMITVLNSHSHLGGLQEERSCVKLN